MSPAFSKLWHDRRGVTSLEFGVVALLLLTLIIGCMDLGRYYVLQASLRTLGQETARAALADTTMFQACTTGVPWARIKNIVPLLDTSQVTLCVTQNPSSTGIITVTVTASVRFTPFTPIWNSLSGTLTDISKLSY